MSCILFLISIQTIKQESDELRQMQERNEGIERDVQRYKDRIKIEHTVSFRNINSPQLAYI